MRGVAPSACGHVCASHHDTCGGHMTGQVRLGRDTENGVAHSSGARAECLRGVEESLHTCPGPHNAPRDIISDLPRLDLPKAPDEPSSLGTSHPFSHWVPSGAPITTCVAKLDHFMFSDDPQRRRRSSRCQGRALSASAGRGGAQGSRRQCDLRCIRSRTPLTSHCLHAWQDRSRSHL